MKTATWVIHLLTGAACLLCPACQNEPARGTTDTSAVTGRWELFQAFRNQKETETLRGTYFEFMPDGQMRTNLPVGAEAPTAYSLENGTIRQQSNPPVEYRVVSASDSMLELSTELRGLSFILRFRRAAETDTTAMPFADTLGIETVPSDSVGQ